MAHFHLVSRIKQLREDEFLVSVAILPASHDRQHRPEVHERKATTRSEAINVRGAMLMEAGARVRMRGDVVSDVEDQ
jgi:hypothetical protein